MSEEKKDKLAELEAEAIAVDGQIEELRGKRRRLARAIEAETKRRQAARPSIPGPKIGG